MTDHWTDDDAAGSDDSPVDVTDEMGPWGGQNGSGASETRERDGVAATEAYEQDDVVVLYDAGNPLAWIETDSAVTVDSMA